MTDSLPESRYKKYRIRELLGQGVPDEEIARRERTTLGYVRREKSLMKKRDSLPKLRQTGSIVSVRPTPVSFSQHNGSPVMDKVDKEAIAVPPLHVEAPKILRVPSWRSKRYLAIAIAIVFTIGVVAGVSLSISLSPSIPATIDDDIPEPVRIIPVASMNGLSAAIGTAIPGDHIVVRNGVYVTSSHIVVAARGTASNPIVITPEIASGVEIAGTHGFGLDGAQHVIIRGFKFTHSQDSSASTDDIAIMCKDCHNVRFTGNTFALTTEYAGENDTKSIDQYHSHWLGFSGSGSNNRIDHNTFQNKSTRGTFLILLGENGIVVQNSIVDHNRFSGHAYRQGNGGECMTVGNSDLAPSFGNTVIEHNTFERCYGDREAISIKSSNNVIRYNIFHNNRGSLTFRHGNGNVADGNIFLDGDNGIRVYGHDHKIINNYFANNHVQVSSLLSPIIVGKGSIVQDLHFTNAEYSQPHNILIVHNTFVNNGVSIVLGYGDGHLSPEGVIIANNIVTGSDGEFVQVYSGDVTFRNNILYPTGSATIGDIAAGGYTIADPQLENANLFMRPAATSPAIDATSILEGYGITTDIDGQTRSGRLDIGADEVR